MKHHLTATECHLPYGITQCYLLPDTSEHTPPSPQPDRPVIDLPTPEGWKAKLTLLHNEMVYLPTDGHPSSRPSTNRAQCRLTTLIEANALTSTPRRHPKLRLENSERNNKYKCIMDQEL